MSQLIIYVANWKFAPSYSYVPVKHVKISTILNIRPGDDNLTPFPGTGRGKPNNWTSLCDGFFLFCKWVTYTL